MMDRAQANGVGTAGYRGSFRSRRLRLGALGVLGGWLGGAAAGANSQTAPQAKALAPSQSRALPDAPSALLVSLAAAPVDAPRVASPHAPSRSGLQEQQAVPSPSPPAPPVVPPSSQAAPAPQTAAQADAANQAASALLPRCPHAGLSGTILFLPGKTYGPCQEQNQLQSIIDSGPVRPLSPSQKGLLAVRGTLDPFNFITIAGFSGITIAANSHTAYGPGFKGFGTLVGYSLVGDIQGEFIGTYAIPVLTREDPRYHRLPGRPFSRRLAHALVHTYVTQHDNGSLMPNYSALLGYPIGAEISNLYVPGLQTNGPATAERIAVGIGTDPAGALIAEFLPDVARHIHIHVIFMQQILNQVATGSSSTPP
jgi:hypothetical protein